MLRNAERSPIGKIKSSQNFGNLEFVDLEEVDLLKLGSLFYQKVDNATPIEVVHKLLAHNSETLMVFKNTETYELGFVALLPLTAAGHIALADERFDPSNPDLEHVSKAGQQPSAIYVWGVGVTPNVAGGLRLVMNRLDTFPYKDKTLYAKAANKNSFRLLQNLGFTKGAYIHGTWRTDLMAYVTESEGSLPLVTSTPTYDSYIPFQSDSTEIGIKVVHNSVELSQVLMIRGAAYMGEQAIPWSEDMDGNDFCSAHLIGYVGQEPAACLRLRFFANFAKIERLAVLPKYRNRPIAARMVRAGIDFGRTKGYQRFYGQSEKDVVPMWKRFGFVPRTTDPIKYKTDLVYLEGDMFAEPVSETITPCSDPRVILRPEGQWHKPGPLEND